VSLHGAVPLSTLLDTIGPLAHTVDDCALLTEAMAGADPRDPGTRGAPAVDFAGALAAPIGASGLRVAVLAAEQFPKSIDPEIVRARDDAIGVLRAQGAQIVELRAPISFEDIAARLGKLLAAEAYALRRTQAEDAALRMDPWVRKRILGGKGILAADFVAEVHAMRAAQAEFAGWMREWDALLTPTLPITATVLDEVDEATSPLASFTRAVNYLGGCGLSLPAGLSKERLPMGVQLIGAPFAEASLVRLGRAFQHATKWHLARPPS
jgi:aspartyl-tRNA(Asn)/glutamyl-tRNA(Gln) amidotransferase subunit A